MILVTQSFGNELEYKRAVFCILSYYAHCSPEHKGVTFLFTDNPAYFQRFFKKFPVRYFLLTSEKIKAMRGSIDFLHRMKIALLEESFNDTDQDLLYADSDTFFLKDPAPLMVQVSEHVSLMHLPEYSFESMRNWRLPAGVPFRAFIEHISNREFKMPDNSLLKIDPNWYSWNAGVMMFHRSHKKIIPEVYALTDQFYPYTNNHACEQYAFSIVMQKHTQVRSCESISYHYWYRVKKKIADLWLEKEFKVLDKLSDEELLDRVKHNTRSLQALIENHILFLKDEAIQHFNENKFLKGYLFALRVLVKNPLQFRFIKDVLYHTKRFLTFKNAR